MNSLIRKCVDEIKDNLDGTCFNATQGATDCLGCFQGQYFGGNPISYDCETKINIYVARYFPVHVRENTEALNLLPRDFKQRILRQNPINIMSIGGGPGSDSYAIKNFLAYSEMRGEIASAKNIYLLRIDKEELWNGIAGVVHSKHQNTQNLNYCLKRQIIDITDRANWLNNGGRLFNLFTMSYFLSELISDDQVRIVADYINNHSSGGCSFITINDRNDQKVNYFKNILFENLSCNTDYEAADSTIYHCGFSYNDNDRDLVGPKLKTNSIRFLKALYI